MGAEAAIVDSLDHYVMTSDFDFGILQGFTDGALNVMPDTILLNGWTLNVAVTSRTVMKRNIRGGKSYEVSGSIECARADFLKANGQLNGGDLITYSDELVGKVTSIDDPNSPVLTLQIGPPLEGVNPSGGVW